MSNACMVHDSAIFSQLSVTRNQSAPNIKLTPEKMGVWGGALQVANRGVAILNRWERNKSGDRPGSVVLSHQCFVPAPGVVGKKDTWTF